MSASPINSVLDRISPSHRPGGANQGTQRWESLLFMHWEISPEALQKQLPSELEVDTFEGRAWIGIVPFKMCDIRPSWLPKSVGFNFLETNVRTYVVHKGRPGVYFLSLDANFRPAVWAARIGWSLPYRYATMSAFDDASDGDPSRSRGYQSRRAGGTGRHRVSFRVGDRLGASQPGTFEHFLLERYLLFVKRRSQVYVGQVHHQPYEAFAAIVDEFDESLLDAVGLHVDQTHPQVVHYSPGVDVEVFGVRKSV